MAISLLVVYSSNIANDTGLASIPIATRIQTAINDANQIYQNSGASQRLELKLAQQMAMTSQDEVDTRQTIVNLFADLAGSTYAARGGYAGAIAALRKQNKADVVVFWSTVPSQSAARTNGAQARDAYLSA